MFKKTFEQTVFFYVQNFSTSHEYPIYVEERNDRTTHCVLPFSSWEFNFQSNNFSRLSIHASNGSLPIFKIGNSWKQYRTEYSYFRSEITFLEERSFLCSSMIQLARMDLNYSITNRIHMDGIREIDQYFNYYFINLSLCLPTLKKLSLLYKMLMPSTGWSEHNGSGKIFPVISTRLIDAKSKFFYFFVRLWVSFWWRN